MNSTALDTNARRTLVARRRYGTDVVIARRPTVMDLIIAGTLRRPEMIRRRNVAALPPVAVRCGAAAATTGWAGGSSTAIPEVAAERQPA